MYRSLIGVVRNLAAVLLFAPALSIQHAAAQDFPDKYIPGTDAGVYARYYAPYAIQAGAAYADVGEFNARSDPADQQKFVVEFVAGSVSPDPQVELKRQAFLERAPMYLRHGDFNSVVRAMSPVLTRTLTV
jgi:hypothetical protein